MLAVNNSPYLQGIIQADSGYLNNMAVEGSLTMGDEGKVANENADYKITDQGIGVRQHNGSSIDKPKAFHIYDGFNQVTGSLWGTSYDNTTRLVSENTLFLEAKGGDTVLASTSRVQVSGAPFRLPRYTDANRPTNPKEGDVIYNTTINRAEVWNGNSWADMSQ